MKFADTQLQGQNMTNNMITLGSILEKSPNYNIKGAFWNGSVYVPSSGDLLKGNNQGNNTTGRPSEEAISELMNRRGITWMEAYKYLTNDQTTTETYPGMSNIPTKRTIKQNRI